MTQDSGTVAAPIIQIDDTHVRIGDRAVAYQYTDQRIDGWIVGPSGIIREGTWDVRPWTDSEIAAYTAAERRHRKWSRRLAARLLRTTVRLGRHFPIYVDQFDYDDEGDYRRFAPGLRGRIARNATFRFVVNEAQSLLAAPSDHRLSIGTIQVCDGEKQADPTVVLTGIQGATLLTGLPGPYGTVVRDSLFNLDPGQ